LEALSLHRREVAVDSIEAQIAAHVASVRYEDLPAAAVASARRAIVDTVACSLAGSQVPSVGPVVELASSWGGVAEARVLGFGHRLPAPLAAWCNGMMARVLELDDCTDTKPMHPSASTVPALLAIAEARGGISGRELIAALAVAQDVKIRLGLAVRVDAMVSGRYNLFKVFGPAAAVARALKLDVGRTHHALGIAYAYACGEGQSAPEGASSLPLQQGTVAQNGLIAALLAEKGNTGSRDFLFGRAGYFLAFEPDHDAAPITAQLGEQFRGDTISIKPYAACRCCHEGIELAQRFHQQFGGGIPIRRARLHVGPNIRDFVGAQIENATDPFSPTAAQFSLPFTVATALVRGDFFLRELQPEVIRDPAVRALAHRIEVIGDPACTSDFVLGRARLGVETESGETCTFATELPPGNPSKPLDFAACSAKLRKCAAFSIRPPSAPVLQHFIDRVERLEMLDDTRDLLEGL
jgi:2-methylcitrate dehydratase PrpD